MVIYIVKEVALAFCRNMMRYKPVLVGLLQRIAEGVVGINYSARA